MILSKKELQFYIAADRILAGKKAKKALKEYIKGVFNPDYIINYLRSMRKVAYYKNTNHKKSLGHIYHLWNYRRLGAKLGFSIGYNTFDYGLLVPHYGTVVVNEMTTAGKYCVLHTCTCIGGPNKVIGDALYMSSGAQIMGSYITLGDNVSISASSMVNKPIETSNVLLVGIPATIKKTYAPWYSGEEKYVQRIKIIEDLRKQMNL